MIAAAIALGSAGCQHSSLPPELRTISSHITYLSTKRLTPTFVNQKVDATIVQYQIDLPFQKAYDLLSKSLISRGWTVADPPHDLRAQAGVPGPPDLIAEFCNKGKDQYVLESDQAKTPRSTKLGHFVSLIRTAR